MEKTEDATFGSLLRRFRQDAELTQEQLAERANLSVRGIGYLERDLRIPWRATVLQLVEALQLSSKDRAALLSASRRRPPGSPRLPAIAGLPPTPLLGRAQEVREILGLLEQPQMRLLTLVGTGGVGKTRLALEVAVQRQDRVMNGAAIVSLASLHDPQLVLFTVAQALEVRESAGGSVTDTLVAYLQEKQALLLLDNFEHLLPAASALAHLITTCPHLQLLVTSRQPVHVRGEQVYTVGPLPLVGTGTDKEGPPAVQLFINRAREGGVKLNPDEETTQTVAQICRRLDGLPLAIELAAARTRVLAPGALLQRLEHRLPLLTGGPRDLPLRQHTMRSTIAWSYDLLDRGEQALFRRLAVFVGGCGLEAAEAVCAGEDDGGVEVLQLLESLVDQSVVLTRQENGGPRFGMLETVREYALERLEESGEAERLREKHAAYFLALAEAAAPELSGPRQAAWLGRLDAETDNFRAALDWWLDARAGMLTNVEEALRLATALWRFWYEQGHWIEGRAWLRRALEAGEGVAAPVRARALNTAGMAALFQGEYEHGRLLLTESLELFRSLGSKHGIASCLTFLGYVAAAEMDEQRVRNILAEAAALRPHVTHPSVLAYLVSFLGLAHATLGDLEEALAFLGQSAELFRQLGDDRGRRQSLAILGLTLLSVGDGERAEALFHEALVLSQASRDVLVTYFCLFGIAGLAALRRQLERAVVLWGAADRLRLLHGLDLNLIARQSSRYDANLASARERLGEAAFAIAWDEGDDMPVEEAVEYALDLE